MGEATSSGTTTKANWPWSVVAELKTMGDERLRPFALSFGCFFSVLCCYYIIRPLRDELSAAANDNLRTWLFTGVFFVMLAAVPIFGWVTSRFQRRNSAPIVYAFFLSNILLFAMLIGGGIENVASAAIFFIWVSVFNLFVVSLFWIVMADTWSSDEAKQVYGYIAAGGSAGAFCGPLITQSLVHTIGPANLMLIAAFMLAAALGFALALRASMHSAEAPAGAKDNTTLSNIFAGALRVWQSPYLFKIALWVLVANVISTFFYFEQSRIVGAAFKDRADRVQWLARMDLAVSIMTILAQVFLTRDFIRRLGLGTAIAAMPASALLALIALAAAPILWVVTIIVVVERAIHFSVTNPASKILFTVTEPEEKFKAQNFIDTVVFRGGDAASGWLFKSVAQGFGIGTAAVAALTLPFALAWIYLSFALGRDQEARAAAQERAKSRDRERTSAR